MSMCSIKTQCISFNKEVFEIQNCRCEGMFIAGCSKIRYAFANIKEKEHLKEMERLNKT